MVSLCSFTGPLLPDLCDFSSYLCSCLLTQLYPQWSLLLLFALRFLAYTHAVPLAQECFLHNTSYNNSNAFICVLFNDVCFPQTIADVMAAESGVELNENQSNEKRKTTYSGFFRERKSAIVTCVPAETQRQRNEKSFGVVKREAFFWWKG